MLKTLKAASLAALLMAIPITVAAQGYSAGALKIGHPWSKPTPPNAPGADGFLTITNTGSRPDHLLSASTPIATRVEVHEMYSEGGAMRMRPIAGGLLLPPGKTVTLEPGGYHLMMVRPDHALKVGDHVPAKLHFERAGDVAVEFYVQAEPPPVGKGMPMDHMKMH